MFRGIELEWAFYRPLRVAVTVLWLMGAALAAGTAPFAWSRLGVVDAVPFIVAGGGLMVLAVGTLRGVRPAVVTSLILLGAQVLGVVGASWELSHNVTSAKAGELRSLGVDPTLGVLLNLIFSVIASGMFGWAVTRMRRARTAPGP